jgi:hypothetical protein
VEEVLDPEPRLEGERRIRKPLDMGQKLEEI